MIIKDIYLDMDGLLSDFVAGALKVHNLPDPWLNNPSNRGFFDMGMLWGMPQEDFWEPINEIETFWYDLPKCEHADDLLALLKSLTLSKTSNPELQIATSPVPYRPHCYAGKVSWIMTNCNFLTAGAIFINKKHKLANQFSLLVDDSEKNVNSFKKAGGKAILYPRFWNSNHTIQDKPLEYVKRELRILGFSIS